MFKRAARIQFPDDTGKTVRVGAFPRWIGDQSRDSTQVAASCVTVASNSSSMWQPRCSHAWRSRYPSLPRSVGEFRAQPAERKKALGR